MNWIKRLFSKKNRGTDKAHTELGTIEAGIVNEMIRIKPLVVKILNEYPKTKDDDNLLLTIFWEKQVKFELKSYNQFAYLLTNKWLSTPETITRTRRKLQEEHPSLRGELYEKRKNAEKEVSRQISMDFD